MRENFKFTGRSCITDCIYIVRFAKNYDNDSFTVSVRVLVTFSYVHEGNDRMIASRFDS